MLKPRLEIIALANYADVSQKGMLSLNGVLDVIFANTLPSNFMRGFLVLTISGAFPEKELNLNVEINSPDNKTILSQPARFKIGPKGKGNFIAELFGMPLPSVGTYKISVKDGKNELGFTNFDVILVHADGTKKNKSTRQVN